MSLLRMFPRRSLPLLLAFATMPAMGAAYNLPASGSDVVGHVQHIRAKASDTFVKLAHKYDVGYRAMRLANPHVDPWLPGAGTKVVIPTAFVLPHVPHKGIVIDVPEMRIYYFPSKHSKNAGKVFTYPIGIGRIGWATPIAHTRVIQKIRHPNWIPPASIKKEHAEKGDPLPNVVKAGPNNPLGQYALRLALPEYLIHGTNKPSGVGMRVSHGCIRLLAPDIKQLFSMASVGTPVNIISQPYNVGWDGNTLMMQAYPPDGDGTSPVKSFTPWVQALNAATRNKPRRPTYWQRAQQVVEKSRGIPEPIGQAPQRKAQEAREQSNRGSTDQS